MRRVKKNSNTSQEAGLDTQTTVHRFHHKALFFIFGGLVGLFLLTSFFVIYFESKYQGKIYPGIYVGEINASGKTTSEIEAYYQQKSFPFTDLTFQLTYETNVATISGKDLAVHFDEKQSAQQAYLIGRSGHIVADTIQKVSAFRKGIHLPVTLALNTQALDDFLSNLSQSINIEAEDALFRFENGKVTTFKLSSVGRQLNTVKTKELLLEYLRSISSSSNPNTYLVSLPLPIEQIEPEVTTESSNNLGIKEQIGHGTSRFSHSIPGRIHNVALAASRINGHIIPPDSVFSFNEALGDVSAATGFEQAYIIKNGRTVLGDGGGVCQVSTTLFRAALQAGLPITERWAHAYRVGYYEQDSPPGIDATVYSPSNDLKIKNDTGHSILIQTTVDTTNLTMEFDLFGTSDGRVSQISTPHIYAQTPPPADLYQDDPTLQQGQIKQTDFAAAGAKVDFTYKVTRNGTVINDQKFFSNYRPWQAVFLRGTKV